MGTYNATTYLETFSINTLGTITVLECLKELDHNCNAILITSDKCYENVEWVWGYKETDTIGGKDIYSGSKGAAELIIKSYYHSFFDNNEGVVNIASARAGGTSAVSIGFPSIGSSSSSGPPCPNGFSAMLFPYIKKFLETYRPRFLPFPFPFQDHEHKKPSSFDLLSFNLSVDSRIWMINDSNFCAVSSSSEFQFTSSLMASSLSLRSRNF